MTELERLKKALDRLALPESQWCLTGSSIMVLHGLDRKLGDVDLYVSTRTWFEIAQGYRPCDGFMVCETAPLGQNAPNSYWNIWRTDPDDPKRRCDPPFLTKMVGDLEVNIFFNWRDREIGNADPNKFIREAEMVNGYPCHPIERLLTWKVEMCRPKDVPDIEMIRNYLAQSGT